MNLRIPGPIPVPEDILSTLANPLIDHRGPEFKELLYRVTTQLKLVFDTENDIYILTASGTGAMEAAIVNTLSPGDQVVCVTIGAFGDRFGQIAESFGAELIKVSFCLGTAADPSKIRGVLRSNPGVKAVLVTHNETSTGVTNDLETIASVVKTEFDKLLLVDGISSTSSLPLPTDKWGCDVVVAASQKGWMLPPGLSFISFSDRAWEEHFKAQMPKLYFDLSAYKHYYEIGQPPYTPSISTFFALDLALKKLLDEGMANVFNRHAQIGQMTREGIKQIGLSIFPNELIASNTVTAVRVPENIQSQHLIRQLREQHGVVVAGGQQSLSGKIFRIGHMGQCSRSEIQDVIDSLDIVLRDMNFKPLSGN